MIRIDCALTQGSFRLAPRLTVGTGVTVLFGESGAGKTLTLEAVAGLLTPDSGRITLDGRALFDAGQGLDVPPYERRLGYVVQNSALFPHLSVADNVAYGLFDLPRARRRRRVAELLRLLAIDDLADRKPARISGGQAQRAALARALARRPAALLLDEPFAALDEGAAAALRRELRRLVRDLGVPVLMVTHNLAEASYIGDRIAVMDDGQVLQEGERAEVLTRPRTARAARLLGIANVLAGQVVAARPAAVVRTAVGDLQSDRPAPPGGRAVQAALRADQIILTRPDRPTEPRPNMLTVEIQEEADFGHSLTLTARVLGAPADPAPTLEIQIAPHPYRVLGVAAHRRWRVHIPPEAVHVMPG